MYFLNCFKLVKYSVYGVFHLLDSRQQEAAGGSGWGGKEGEGHIVKVIDWTQTEDVSVTWVVSQISGSARITLSRVLQT